MIKDSVLVTYMHGLEVTHTFMESLFNVFLEDNRCNHYIKGKSAILCGAAGFIDCRNDQLTSLLDTDFEWVWCLDTDMGFRPDTLNLLMESADPVNRPVVGALCQAVKTGEPDGRGGWSVEVAPTMYFWDDNEFKGIHPDAVPKNEVVRVDATGLACLLIHRSVIEALPPEPCNRMKYQDGTLIGEDFSLCYQIGLAGFPIHVDTGVKVSHQKSVWIG